MQLNKLAVNLKRTLDNSYPIIIEQGILARLPKILATEYPASRYVIICDRRTKKLYGQALRQKLHLAKLKAVLFSVPEGETSKTLKFKTLLEEQMFSAKCDRKCLVLALGGGVVGDLAGFVAATYMRGLAYIHLPTTLLAMADSAIGGKTGINTAQGKNLLGAFWQPKAVLVDLNLIKTLGRPQIQDGLTEAAKMFIASDKSAFEFLQKNLKRALHRNLKVLQEIVRRAASIKAEIVSSDEQEGGRRAVLNFGHTLGHALEKISGFRLRHGQAVLLGMAAEAKIAQSLGVLPNKDFTAIFSLVQSLGADFKVLGRWPAKKIAAFTGGDKKSLDGKARYVLIKRIGQVYQSGGACAHAAPEKIVIKVIGKMSALDN